MSFRYFEWPVPVQWKILSFRPASCWRSYLARAPGIISRPEICIQFRIPSCAVKMSNLEASMPAAQIAKSRSRDTSTRMLLLTTVFAGIDSWKISILRRSRQTAFGMHGDLQSTVDDSRINLNSLHQIIQHGRTNWPVVPVEVVDS